MNHINFIWHAVVSLRTNVCLQREHRVWLLSNTANPFDFLDICIHYKIPQCFHRFSFFSSKPRMQKAELITLLKSWQTIIICHTRPLSCTVPFYSSLSFLCFPRLLPSPEAPPWVCVIGVPGHPVFVCKMYSLVLWFGFNLCKQCWAIYFILFPTFFICYRVFMNDPRCWANL